MNRQLDSLFKEGVLDEQQFMELQQLQDESTPNFVSDLVKIYFRESEKCLRVLREMLSDREFSDYKNLVMLVYQLMDCNSAIGAKKARKVCADFHNASQQNNRVGCLRALELLEHEYYYLKNRLHEPLQMEQQRVMRSRY